MLEWKYIRGVALGANDNIQAVWVSMIPVIEPVVRMYMIWWMNGTFTQIDRPKLNVEHEMLINREKSNL